MQLIGQAWLMLDLHGSGLDLGALAAAQFLPITLFGPYGGLIADRSDKRRLLTVTQSLSLVITLALAVLAASGEIRMWMLFVLAAALGLVSAVDGPTRQVFASDMVPPALVPNAVSLNEVVVNGARVFGPALGAVLIVSFGTSSTFFFNSASFVPALIAVRMMRLVDMHSTAVAVAGPGQLREGLRYASRTPIVRTVVFVASAASGIFNFGVSLPLMATTVLHAGAAGYGSMVAAFGVGAIGGALIAARDHRPDGRRVQAIAVAAGISVVTSACMPNLTAELVLQAVSGLFAIWFYSLANAVVLLRTTPVLRGRVMGLWAMALAGSLPISGPVVGWVAESIGPREALATSGVLVLCAAILGTQALRADVSPRP